MKKLFFMILCVGLLLAKSDNDALIKDIKQSLMAPCCWGGTVYDHGHSQMETEIEEFVAQGKTKDQILNYYVGLYGERILAIPVASGFNLFAWIAPIVIGGIGIFILIMFIKTPKEAEPKTVVQESNVPFNDEIEKELAEMD